jgi:hypothetical protein
MPIIAALPWFSSIPFGLPAEKSVPAKGQWRHYASW